jgi:hypothetical protein
MTLPQKRKLKLEKRTSGAKKRRFECIVHIKNKKELNINVPTPRSARDM